jgi:hypothetical protein
VNAILMHIPDEIERKGSGLDAARPASPCSRPIGRIFAQLPMGRPDADITRTPRSARHGRVHSSSVR